MKKLHPSHERMASSVLDHASVIAAFFLAAAIASILERFGLFVWPGPGPSDVAGWPEPYVALLVTSLVLWTAASTYTGVYRQARDGGPPRGMRRLWRTMVLWAAATTAAIFFLKLHVVSRQFSLTFFALAAVLMTFREFAEAALDIRLEGAGANRRAIVVGLGPERHAIAEAVARSHDFRPSSVRELDPAEVKAASYDPLPRNAKPGRQMRDHAFVVTAGLAGRTLEGVVLGLLRRRWCVHLVPALVDTRLFRYRLDEFGGTPVIRLEAGHLAPSEAALKRAVDVMGAAFGMAALAPILGAIAAAIKLTSRGPVLFTQPRIGRDGVRFRMYKFRSMRTDAEQLLAKNPELYARYVANNFKVPEGEDFRVTRLGRFLRATSLDELPQLWNVLKGEMSLVGPRPVVPDEIQRYGEFAPLLLSVKPGVTGHWQTSGRSRITEYSRRVVLDMEYIRDQSFRTDVEILIRTVGKVARREGSY
jgi:exopolysaccharide biosynthesis polyprenyl glycosylphosphotransferase